MYYPWYSDAEASDAWRRRPKPSFSTLQEYVMSMLDGPEEKPDLTVYYTVKALAHLSISV